MKTAVCLTFSRILVRGGLILFLCAITAGAGTLAFNYDLAGRLTTAAFADSKSIAYTYDRAGNLLQRQVSVGSANPDTDGDGLADTWEQLYFGNLSRNGSGDFDSDGFLDLSEFLAGTVPSNAASLLRLSRNPVSGVGGVLVEWSSVIHRTYRVQFKSQPNLGVWSNVVGDITVTGSLASKLDTSAAGQTQRLYRVLLLP